MYGLETTLCVLCADEGPDGYPEKVIAALEKKDVSCLRLPKVARKLPNHQYELSFEPWREEMTACVKRCVCLVWIVTTEFLKLWNENMLSNGQFSFQSSVRDVLNAFHAKYRQDDVISENRVFPIRDGVNPTDIREICSVFGAAMSVDSKTMSVDRIADTIKAKASGGFTFNVCMIQYIF